MNINRSNVADYGRDNNATSIVIHHTAGNQNATHADVLVNFRTWTRRGYHYIIRGNGEIHQSVQEHSQSWGAANQNANRIHIALTGNFEIQKPTQAQINSARQLTADIRQRRNIARNNVLGHRQVPNQATACPGHNLDVTNLIMESNGWVQRGGLWYFYANNTRQTGWLKDRGDWYFLNNAGVMQTGWVRTGGSWFFMNNSGRMQTGWLQRGDTWYFLANSGRMQTGWLQRGANWYFLNPVSGSGHNSSRPEGAMLTGWLQRGTRWYFLANSGRMQTGNVLIDRQTHSFNPNGVWQGRK